MATKVLTTKKIRKAIVARITAINTNQVMEQMGLDVDRMRDDRYTILAKLIQDEQARMLSWLMQQR